MSSEVLDLDALEKVAQEATPGPWDADCCSAANMVFAPQGSIGVDSIEADARHIAAFDPPTALALIAELKDHRRTIRIWKVGEREARLEAERNALQAKLDRITAMHVRDAVLRDYCAECSDFGSDQFPPGQLITWPCPTIQAIGEPGE